jgi:predicted metal-binding protein
MDNSDLDKYCSFGKEHGATDAKVIDPNSVVTAAWVKWKCRYGCPDYGVRYTCPPESPSYLETRAILDCYQRAILFHQEQQATSERGKLGRGFLDAMIELEFELFRNGYYKALVFLAGPCHLCKECSKPKGLPCNFGLKARPCMESCGIDVFQTARNNGYSIQTLRDKGEIRNIYCLMLVD